MEQTVPTTLWKNEIAISIDLEPRLIAVKAINSGGEQGFLVSITDTYGVDLILTNDTWRCSTELESGWETVEFREHSDKWSSAVVIANHGKGVWGKSRPYVVFWNA